MDVLNAQVPRFGIFFVLIVTVFLVNSNGSALANRYPQSSRNNLIRQQLNRNVKQQTGGSQQSAMAFGGVGGFIANPNSLPSSNLRKRKGHRGDTVTSGCNELLTRNRRHDVNSGNSHNQADQMAMVISRKHKNADQQVRKASQAVEDTLSHVVDLLKKTKGARETAARVAEAEYNAQKKAMNFAQTEIRNHPEFDCFGEPSVSDYQNSGQGRTVLGGAEEILQRRKKVAGNLVHKRPASQNSIEYAGPRRSGSDLSRQRANGLMDSLHRGGAISNVVTKLGDIGKVDSAAGHYNIRMKPKSRDYFFDTYVDDKNDDYYDPYGFNVAISAPSGKDSKLLRNRDYPNYIVEDAYVIDPDYDLADWMEYSDYGADPLNYGDNWPLEEIDRQKQLELDDYLADYELIDALPSRNERLLSQGRRAHPQIGQQTNQKNTGQEHVQHAQHLEEHEREMVAAHQHVKAHSDMIV